MVQDEDIENGIGNYVLLTTRLEGKESPKLGVMVEEKGQRLKIIGVSQKSPAQKAGLKKGDVINRFADHPIQSLADLKLNLFFCKSGSTVKVQVKRGDKMIDKNIELFHFEQFSH